MEAEKRKYTRKHSTYCPPEGADWAAESRMTRKRKNKSQVGYKENTSFMKKCFHILDLVVLVTFAVILVLCICTAVIYLEVAKLKPRLARLQQIVDVHDKFNTSILQLNKTQALLLTTTQQLFSEVLGRFHSYPVSSCAVLSGSSYPSGYYWVKTSNGSARVYCDITRTCGGIIGGWIRIANLNMKDPTMNCPSAFTQNATLLRTCRIASRFSGCSKVVYPVNNVEYTSVCGRVIGYQIGSPKGFGTLGLDGVSITHGNLVEHIWSL